MNHYLITGATGVVGNALMQSLLNQSEYQLYLLIRADNKATFNDKIEQLKIIDSKNKDKLKFILGDITKKNFGIEINQLNFLKNNLNGLVHAAANVKLNQPLDTARQNAFTGTKTAIDLAKSCKHFRHFHYISTVGVNGMSKSTLLETSPPENVIYHNTYEQAKAETEQYVIEQMTHGLPCTIYRPSMIVGDSKTGAIYSKQIFYYICDFIIRGGVARTMPSLSHFYLDTIPIDNLVNFISACMSHDNETVGKIYNVCSGYEHSVNMQQLTEWLKSSMKKHNYRIPMTVSLPISLYNIILDILFLFSNQHIKKQIGSLAHLLTYLKNSPKFSNQQYTKDAKLFGLPIMHPSQYLTTTLDAYLTSDHTPLS